MLQHPLTPTQIEQYRRDGFVMIPSVFNREDLAAVDQTIRDIADRAISTDTMEGVLELEPEPVNGERVPRRILNPFEQHDKFRKIATDDRILDRIESLVGPDIALHHSKLNAKPAKVGSIVEWHQDLAYFPHTNDDLVTTLIYLDDATEENGCLQVLPRHHTHYFDHRMQDGTFAGMITEPIGDGRFGKPISLAGPAGSVIFMHCLTPHTSLPNRSNRGRRTLIFEYRASDSFPIFTGEYVTVSEAHAHHIRGSESRIARFGGPSPEIPRMPATDKYKSLYALQAEAKAAAEVVSV